MSRAALPSHPGVVDGTRVTYRPDAPRFAVVLSRAAVEAALQADHTARGGDTLMESWRAFLASGAASMVREVLHTRGYTADTTEVVVLHPEAPEALPAWALDAYRALPLGAFSADPAVDGIARAVVTLYVQRYSGVNLPFKLDADRAFRKQLRASGVMVGFPFDHYAPADGPPWGFFCHADYRTPEMAVYLGDTASAGQG